MVKFFHKVNGFIKYKLRQYLGIEINQSLFTKEYLSEKSFCEVGEYSYGRPKVNKWGNGSEKLKIGKFCSIAYNVEIFLDGEHRADWISTYPFGEFYEIYGIQKIDGHPIGKGNVTIGNDVWIGQNALILSGVEIKDGAIVGANSLVTRNIGAYEIWAGNPARFIKKRFNDEDIRKLIEIKWWNWELNKIIKNYKIICSSNLKKLYEL
jgi:acetyltransferase-like isoleucine patch superfamily enzyme